MIIDIPKDSDFSIHNIPFGIFSTSNTARRVGVAVGDHILDLAAVADLGLFDFDISVFQSDYLNDFIALGKPITNKVRTDIQSWLQDDTGPLANKPNIFIPQKDATMHLPVRVGDYTDFYSSIDHATNVGKMFRPGGDALLPNWRHLPVGYHGRSSSIIVSGTDVHRPKGQLMPKDATAPIHAACRLLDFELEMAFIVGKSNELGQPISTADAAEHIFGMVIFNDWSARDVQKWEYIPLGPFNAKNFASSISPWVVTMEALAPFKVDGVTQEPEVLEYLKCDDSHHYDINLSVIVQPQDGKESVISESNYKYMYWNMAQQLAHHTSTGCNMQVGDMLASGTISGPTPDSLGCMLELSWAGSRKIELADGEERVFLQDGDTVTMRGHAEKSGVRVGFGEVTGTILPAL